MSEISQNFSERQKLFIEEYGKLVKKYECDFMSFPQFVPEEKKEKSFPTYKLQIFTQVMDTKQSGVPSPFM
jgi:hypothetical protein